MTNDLLPIAPEPGIELRMTDVVENLRRTPATLDAWLRGRPEPWLRRREGPDSWSPHEVIGHLVHGERTDWLPRLRQMLEGRGDVPFEPFDRFAMLRESRDRTTEELLGDFATLRAENLAEIEEMDLGPDALEMSGTHPDLGAVTVRQLLATWVAHDLTHIAQIARVMAKQYRSEVGPWRAYLPLLDRVTGAEGDR